MFNGKYAVEEVQNPSAERKTYLVSGKRGGAYGCIEQPDGRFTWFNMGRGALNSVPFDLAQVTPSQLRADLDGNV